VKKKKKKEFFLFGLVLFWAFNKSKKNEENYCAMNEKKMKMKNQTFVHEEN
jgi:cbb3-type cytochrome oxidase subunit 3